MLGRSVRWFLFFVLIFIGIQAAIFLGHNLGRFAAIGWVGFGMLWVPASYYLSESVGNKISKPRRPEPLDSKKPLGLKPRCPSCKTDVESDQVLCPSCYEDLMTNCQECARPIKSPHKVCRECAKKHKENKLRMRGF